MQGNKSEQLVWGGGSKGWGCSERVYKVCTVHGKLAIQYLSMNENPIVNQTIEMKSILYHDSIPDKIKQGDYFDMHIYAEIVIHEHFV